MRGRRLLRRRDGHEANVTFEELFFDLVCAFSVTQISHFLLHHQSANGAMHALVLWFAVWLGTNWFDPEKPAIRHAVDPGRMAAYFHYVHVILIAGIIVMAVGNDLALAQPGHAASLSERLILFGGPAIFLGGSLLYKRAVYGCVAPSHVTGTALFVLLTAVSAHIALVLAEALASGLLVVLAVWESFILPGARQDVRNKGAPLDPLKG